MRSITKNKKYAKKHSLTYLSKQNNRLYINTIGGEDINTKICRGRSKDDCNDGTGNCKYVDGAKRKYCKRVSKCKKGCGAPCAKLEIKGKSYCVPPDINGNPQKIEDIQDILSELTMDDNISAPLISESDNTPIDNTQNVDDYQSNNIENQQNVNDSEYSGYIDNTQNVNDSDDRGSIENEQNVNDSEYSGYIDNTQNVDDYQSNSSIHTKKTQINKLDLNKNIVEDIGESGSVGSILYGKTDTYSNTTGSCSIL